MQQVETLLASKFCKHCKLEKNIVEFGCDNSTKDKIKKTCKACNRLKCREWKKSHKEIIHDYNVKYHLKNTSALLKKANKSNRTIKGRYATLRINAAKRGLDVTFSIEEYCNLVSKNECKYCEDVLPETGHGLDRIDNKLGYNLENVVPCCSFCNFSRQDFVSHQQMFLIGPLIRKDREGKSTVFTYPPNNRKKAND